GDKGVEATASDNLSSRLPYKFAVSRFAHYLKCMVRDKIGSMKEKDELTNWLQTWINEYVDANPAMSSEAQKARKPLAAAKVEVIAKGSTMAVDIFLKLDPLKGESLDTAHKGEIDVLSWGWGLDQTGTFHHGS